MDSPFIPAESTEACRLSLGHWDIADGCKRIRLNPQLGSLQYAKGSFPTPKGLLTVCCEKQLVGTVDVRYTAPDGIEIVF